MQEPTFGSLEFESKKRQTRRERFLERLDALVPWAALELRIAPVYPQPGRGRRPYPLALMLRGSLRAALLQPQRPGDGGPALRGRVGAPLLRTQPQWADPRRVDDPALSSSPGASSAGRGAVADDQRTPGKPGPAAAGRHDRGREHHRRAVLDQEPAPPARPGDASDQEGQRVALRDEAAYRGGRRHGSDTQPEHDGGQQRRRDRGASAVARRRTRGLGRRRLPGRRTTAGTGGLGGRMAGRDASRPPPAPRAGQPTRPARA